MTINNGLLDIKQAAKLLNVSEVSLRRWTNEGRLACLRLGPKRERRFRQEDLEAFMESQNAVRKRPEAVHASPNLPVVGGIRVDHHCHVCGLYDDDAGRMKLAVPFLAEGLRLGQLCVLVARRDALKAILAHLKPGRNGMPDFAVGKELVVSEGETSGDAMLDVFERVNFEARAAGHSIRWVGDMTWTSTKRISTDELMDFEMRVDFLAQRFPLAAICQYDLRHFSGRAVLRALKCHGDTFRYPLALG
jgi:transcriptional repressor of dcmA and dcmR